MTAVSKENRMPAFSGTFVADDEPVRRSFDHELGLYLHERRGGWNAAAITDVLDFVGGHATTAFVDLDPLPDRSLRVTISYEIPPARR